MARSAGNWPRLATTMHKVAALLSFVSLAAEACTSIAMGRKATADGSVIIGQSSDGDTMADGRVLFVPARDFPEGAMAPVYYSDGPFPRWVSTYYGPGYSPNNITGPAVTEPIGYIPQVRHTFAYHDENYGIINEHNVAIDETTCSAIFQTCAKGDTRGCGEGRTEGVALLDSRMLTMFGLERATTAREAVKIMGDLAYEYGFYGTHDFNGDGESLMVGDSTEAWVFHILADPTGAKAIWAAVRVPDDSVTIASNMFTIRAVDTTDTENCMASPNIYSVAEERGWWKSGEVLDFTRTYSDGEYDSKYYSGRRMWRVLSLAAPSLDLNPEYNDLRYDRDWPWAVKPDIPIKLEDVFSWYRDYYVGSKFDMTKQLASGPGGTPDRFDSGGAGDTDSKQGSWPRSIAIFRTQVVKVQHLLPTTPARPREVAGVAWVLPGPAHFSPAIPFPSGFGRTVWPLANRVPTKPDEDCLNWVIRKVMMTAQIRFDHMHPIVEAAQAEMEDVGRMALAEATAKLVSGTASGEALWEPFEQHVWATLKKWQSLTDKMIYSFADNSAINKMSTWPVGKYGMAEDKADLFYPKSWLKAVGFYDMPIPPQEMCPPACPGIPSHLVAAAPAEAKGLVFGLPFLAIAGISFAILATRARRRTLPKVSEPLLVSQ